MTLILTNTCNLACTYCYATEWENSVDRNMEFETAMQGVERMIRETIQKKISIIFTGGEPLLKYELIKDIVKKTKELCSEANKSAMFSFITNGLLLDEEKITFFKANDIRYTISIDGFGEEANANRVLKNGGSSYSMILDAIKVSVKNDVKFQVRITVTKKNLNVYTSVKELRKLGVDNFKILPLISVDENDDVLTSEDIEIFKSSLDKVFEDYKASPNSFKIIPFESFKNIGNQPTSLIDGFICKAGATSAVMTPEGDYYSCAELLDRSKFKMGNVNDEQLNKVYQHRMFSEKCKGCEINKKCTFGCYARFEMMTGNPCEPDDIFCEMSKYYYKKSLEILEV